MVLSNSKQINMIVFIFPFIIDKLIMVLSIYWNASDGLFIFILLSSLLFVF